MRKGWNTRRKGPQEDLINIYRYLKGGDKEDEARLISVVPSARKRGKSYKLVPSTIRKCDKAQRVCGVSSLEIFRRLLDMVLGILL